MKPDLERIIALIANASTVVALCWTAWSSIWGTIYGILLGMALFVVSSSVLFILFVKRKIRLEIEQAVASEDYSKPYLQQLRITYAPYVSWIRSVLVEISNSRKVVANGVRAIEGLADINAPEVKKPLSDLALNDPEPRIRSAAVKGLSELKSVDTNDSLFRALRDEDAGVVISAITGLQGFPGTETLQKLYPLLSHNNYHIKQNSMDAIYEINVSMDPPDVGVIEPVMKVLLNDTDDTLSNQAVDILRYVRAKSALQTSYDQLSLKKPPLPRLLEKIGKAIADLGTSERKE